MRLGDCVLIYFPAEDSGKQRKLSCPWHGPYRIVAKDETNVTAIKVYFPEEKSIKVHQNHVQMCPFNLLLVITGMEKTNQSRPTSKVDGTTIYIKCRE